MKSGSIALLAVTLAVAACSDPPPPIEVSAGRLTARIAPEPAQITLFVDGTEVWRTEAGRGDGTPPNGFASVSSKALTIQQQFGSYRFDENPDQTVWEPIDKLANVVATADGATFELYDGDRKVGTGSLTFVTTTRSGPDPDAAGFPRHVRIALVTDTGDSVSLSTPCPADEHLVGLGGQSFDVDHRGQTSRCGSRRTASASTRLRTIYYQRRVVPDRPAPLDAHADADDAVVARLRARGRYRHARAVFELGAEHRDVGALRGVAARRSISRCSWADPTRCGLADQGRARPHARVGRQARPCRPTAVFAPWIDAIFGSASVRQVAQALRTNGGRGVGDLDRGLARRRRHRHRATRSQENWRVDRSLYPDFEQLASDLHGDGFAVPRLSTTRSSTRPPTSTTRRRPPATRSATRPAARYIFTGVKFNPATLLDLTNPAARRGRRA